MKLVGLTSLALWGVTLYFIIVGQYLDERAFAPADHALVTAVGVLAGACAIPALVLGLAFLTARDGEIMQAQREASELEGEPAREPSS